jgi:CRISPR-associated endonuclease/helicase Cas3
MSSATSQRYAHSLAGRPLEEWQGLEDHLIQTADLAESFASGYAAGWGRIAGLWHDAGKYREVFQEMIGRDPDAHVSGKVDHSSVGALIAAERKAAMLAFVVAGHHDGIPNADDLGGRLKEKHELLPEARRDGLPPWIEDQVLPRSPDWLTDPAQLSLWTRVLFSALVDADSGPLCRGLGTKLVRKRGGDRSHGFALLKPDSRRFGECG